jgi:phosphonate transport system substrate-binding protein
MIGPTMLGTKRAGVLLLAGIFWLAWIAASAAFAAAKPPPGNALVLAVHPYLPREEIVRRFTPLAEYLARGIGRPVEIRVGRTYEEHVEAIGTDKVDIAYLGPGPYVKLVGRYGKKPLLARQELAGGPFLTGYVFVRQESKIQSLADLKGKAVVFGDPESTMSVVPQHMLAQAGVPLSSLANYKFIVGHQNVALAVLAGDFDAGAVKDEVFQMYAPRGLRFIAQTPKIADHLFVANAALPADVVEKLRTLLMDLNNSPSGKVILTSIHPGMDRLVVPKDSDYDSLRAILDDKNAVGQR